MYYEWVAEDEGQVSGRPAQYLAYVEPAKVEGMISDEFGVQVVNWFDEAPGVVYSLSAAGTDLNGMDIQVFAEQLFEPTQGEVSVDPENEAAAELKDYFLGEHTRSEDESTLVITDNGDDTFKVDLSVIRLATFEDGVGTFEEHKINFTITDPAGNDMQGVIYRDSDNSLTVRITDSTWDLLPTDEVLEGFGK